MKIISGSKKSILIKAPKNLPNYTRPTTGKVKESLFNIISNKYNINEIAVLDLFSGSGNISFEFSSRGCNDILAIDNDYRCIKFIKETAITLELKIDTKKNDYLDFLNKNDKKFDLIFADPPYNFELEKYLEILKLVKERDILNDNGVIIIEHSSKILLSEVHQKIDERKYGSTILSFIKKASL